MDNERVTAYTARGDAHARARDVEARRSLRISRLRLATVLPGAACLVWALAGGSTLVLAVGAALLLAFGALVVRHARTDERVAWYDALQTVNLRASARLTRDWRALPGGDIPPGAITAVANAIEHHPYAHDLDIFGHASLFQWLGPSATPAGAITLASWLLAPATRGETIARQRAIAEAATLDQWREHLAAHGVLASGLTEARVDRLLEWGEKPGPLVPGGIALRAGVVALVAATWISLGLWAAGVIPGFVWVTPVLPGIVLSFALGKRLHTAFDRAGAGQRALGRYASLFEHAASPHFTDPKLTDVQARLSAGGVPAHVCMRRLNRILGFAELRTGAAILHFPIQALTLWDFHVVFALERWRRSAGPRIRGWVDALGELDALAALAWIRSDYPGWAFPEIDDTPVLVAHGLAHPLIGDDRRVANDVEVGPPGTMLLVTGSNMSGKSTLLRAIGVNAVLANAGSCVCATDMRLPSIDLQTSIRVQDSLEQGLSYFMAALARLKGVVDSAERERPGRVLLYLLDEILQGTNSVERSIAVQAVARHLLQAGAIGAMTTHDLAVAGEEPLKRAARLVHFSETVDDRGGMQFDYRLRPGIATSRNALRLMKMIGIEP